MAAAPPSRPVPPEGTQPPSGDARSLSEELLSLVGGTTPWLGAIDGFSGAGKTALAGQLAERLRAGVIHADDLVHGWRDLAGSVARMAAVAAQLRSGRTPQWETWDWEQNRPGPEVAYQGPLDRVLIEGCGAGSSPVAASVDLVIWLEVEQPIRETRLRARQDWELYRPWSEIWNRQEESLRQSDDPRPRADWILTPGPTPTQWCRGVWR